MFNRRQFLHSTGPAFGSLALSALLPQWVPDEGPAQFIAQSGSVQVAARFPLVALNINLATTDLDIAQGIAKSVRYINGGFRFVRAIGLALEQAGAYVEATGATLSGYLDLFRQRQRELLRRGRPSTDYPDTVATTWELSFQRVQAVQPVAPATNAACVETVPDNEHCRPAGAEYRPDDCRTNVPRRD